MPTLSSLSAEELVAHLASLVARERMTTVDLLLSLNEMEDRRVPAMLGASTLWAYCIREFHWSNGTTGRNLAAARLLRRFPIAADHLRDGRLNCTTFLALKDVLTPENHLDVVNRAAHLNEDEVSELVAEISPKPDVPERLRKLPTRSQPPSPFDATASTALTSSASPTVTTALNAVSPSTTSSLSDQSSAARPDAFSFVPSAPEPFRPTANLVPLRKHVWKLELTVDASIKAELEELQSLLSHKLGRASLGEILLECIRRTRTACDSQKYGTLSPRKKRDNTSEPGLNRRSITATPNPGATDAIARTPNLGVTSTDTTAASPNRGLATSTDAANAPISGVTSTETIPATPISGVTSTEAIAATPISAVTSTEAIAATPISGVNSTDAAATPSLGVTSTEVIAGTRKLGVTSTETSAGTPNLAVTSTETSAATPNPGVTSTEASAATPNPGVTSTDATAATPDFGASAPSAREQMANRVRAGGRPPRDPSRAVRRAVAARDGRCCQFVGAGGVRCGSKYQLEFDHWLAYALGGEPTVENVRLLCKSHNLLCAIQLFGEEFMAQFIRRRSENHGQTTRDRKSQLSFRAHDESDATSA